MYEDLSRATKATPWKAAHGTAAAIRGDENDKEETERKFGRVN